MKEVRDIITAYEHAQQAGMHCVLATVVQVVGSSYRRPGARMLVREDGHLTGAISGGCLEGDALRKALLALTEHKNKLVTYDTTDDEDAKIGIQLGCNGIIHILFEPIFATEKRNPINLLKSVLSTRENAVLITLFSLTQRNIQPGTICFISPFEKIYNDNKQVDDLGFGCIEKDAITALKSETSLIKNYEISNTLITAFIEIIQPPISIVICGAGNDAMPLLKIATLLGWHITLVDGRATHATTQRFPMADKIIVSPSKIALNKINIDERTAFVLMTHNYNYDIDILRQLAPTSCKYIGILGPKKKLLKMFEELEREKLPDLKNENIYSPVGLNIGAETAEEIALSIASEIKAVFSGETPQFLKDKQALIHNRKELCEVL